MRTVSNPRERAWALRLSSCVLKRIVEPLGQRIWRETSAVRSELTGVSGSSSVLTDPIVREGFRAEENAHVW